LSRHAGTPHFIYVDNLFVVDTFQLSSFTTSLDFPKFSPLYTFDPLFLTLFSCRLVAFPQTIHIQSFVQLGPVRPNRKYGRRRQILKAETCTAVCGERGSLLPTGSLNTNFSRPKGMQDVPKEEDPV
jgi:hypothetical protein